MNYESLTIKKAMRKISQNEIYLPAIQRKFVWSPEKIELLFDSLMRGYPIGTFLFWFVEGAAKENYTFYKFIQDYHERDNPWNEVAPTPDLRDQFIGVLDGQQRLNSLYVALQGSYAFRKRYGRWNDDAAFPRLHLYVNLFFAPKEEDEGGIQYEFSFQADDDAKHVDHQHYWFRVKDVIGWDALTQLMPAIVTASAAHPQVASKLAAQGVEVLSLLWQRLCTEDSISYFSIHEQEIDRITDIFIRVNSAGVTLSKTDLLFSSIVAHWDKGREEIESLIETLNGKGAGFFFNNDFVMRSCLVLADLPVRLRVNSFRKENIERIRHGWPDFKAALESAVDLLVEWGICGSTLPGNSAVVILAYFISKGGDVRGSKTALRQYLIRSQINQVFSSRTDQSLTKIREALRQNSSQDPVRYKLKETTFQLGQLHKLGLPNDRTFQVTNEAIEELLEMPKGAYTFLVLSVLYPQLRFNEVQFHQDHIHPFSQFSHSNLKRQEITQEQIQEWQGKRDLLPNLQLMEGLENKSKNDTPFADWLAAQPNQTYFVTANLIPAGVSLDLREFPTFFEARKNLLRERLKAVFTS